MKSIRIKAMKATVRSALLSAAFAGALRWCATATPVSQESAEAYVRAVTGTDGTNVVLHSATEAEKIIDMVFISNRRNENDCPDRQLERMKRLIANGLAVVVSYDSVGHENSDWSKTFAMRTYRLVRRFHDCDQFTESINDENVINYATKPSCLYDEVVIRKSNGKRVDGFWARECYPGSDTALFGSELEVALDNRAGTNVEASVIADVDTATLSSVFGLEKSLASGEAHPVGHYRVSLLVRESLLGDAPANRLVFTAKTDATNATVDGHWLFYRGMSLKVGLRKTKDGYSISRIEPVLPYPPYTTDNIVVCAADDGDCRCAIPSDSRFSLIYGGFDAVERGRVTILYGDHTRADFRSRRNLIEGPCGTLPDFGANSWVLVWTHGQGSRLDYWCNAWFADGRSLRPCEHALDYVEPLFQSAMEALVFQKKEDRLRFCWWNLVFPSVSFKPPATMKDVADFLTLAARPCLCTDDRQYLVVAEPKVAARCVRPFAAQGIGAFEALRRVASANGCAIRIEGSTVTLYAELTAGVHQRGDTHHIGLQKHARILDRAIYMALGSKINYNIRMLFLKQLIDCFLITDISFNKAEIRVIHN